MVANLTDLTSTTMTVAYFSQEGYYAKNDPRQRRASFWHGAAAAALGLTKHVSPRAFERILSGHVPSTDIRLGRVRDGEHQHRPGFDLTLSDSKTGPRAVPLNSRARCVLDRQPRTGSPFVFPSPRDPARPRSRELALLTQIRLEAGIEDVRLHDLRHTHASHAVMNGVPVPVAAFIASSEKKVSWRSTSRMRDWTAPTQASTSPLSVARPERAGSTATR